MERGFQSTGKLEEMTERSVYLSKARNFAKMKHEGKFRAQGVPIFTHLEAVSRILCEEFRIPDDEKVAVGYLHDTVEDTKTTLEELAHEFGPKMAFWVDGVSQFRSEKDDDTKTKAQKDRETVRKVFSKIPVDPHVAVFKLADRLHNMRTLGFMPIKKQIAKANETKDYAKMAESLGIWEVMKELENLSMQYSCPSDFEKYSHVISEDPRTKDEFVGWLKSTLEIIAADAGINAKVETKMISLAKLQNKMGNKFPREINDLISFRIIVADSTPVETSNNIYIMQRVIRQNFAKIEDLKRYDDFYFSPKDNDYSAIQHTLEFPQGSTEVAITSASKEEFNKWGVVSLIRRGDTELSKHALKLVFTETQEVKFFPPMATGLDFAYSNSPDMGAMADYVLIDGVRCPITTVLPNGAEIKIILKDQIEVQPGLKVFNLPATNRIVDEQILEDEKEKLQLKGENAIFEIISKRGLIDLDDLSKKDKYKANLKHLLFILGCKNNIEDLYYKVGAGVMSPEVLEKYFDNEGITKKHLGLTSVLIEGVDKHGITSMISSKIDELGGNINPQDNQTHNGIFTWRMVIENLTKKREKELLKFLQTDHGFTKVIVV